jgi:hypothetical protein
MPGTLALIERMEAQLAEAKRVNDRVAVAGLESRIKNLKREVTKVPA